MFQSRSTVAAEYVLGLQTPFTRRVTQMRLTCDPALRASVDDWNSRFAESNGQYVEVQPPVGVLSRVEAELFGHPPIRTARLTGRTIIAFAILVVLGLVLAKALLLGAAMR